MVAACFPFREDMTGGGVTGENRFKFSPHPPVLICYLTKNADINDNNDDDDNDITQAHKG